MVIGHVYNVQCGVLSIAFAVHMSGTGFDSRNLYCYDIKPVRKEEGKSYWKIPLCDDDATREK